MTWFFYNKEGKLLYDVVTGSVGDADTLDGIDSTGFLQIDTIPVSNTGSADLTGSIYLPFHNISADLDLTAVSNYREYRTISVNNQAAPRTITLPNSVEAGQVYEIRDTGSTGLGNADVNNITITPTGGELIDGAASLVINEKGKAVTLVYNGFNWLTFADRSPVAGGTVDADTLDTLDSTQFLRSDVDDTAAGNITFSQASYNPISAPLVANTTLDDTYKTVLVDTATPAAPVTITLPAAPTNGLWYEIKDFGGAASTDNIIIDPNGNNIDGVAANYIINDDYDSVVLVYRTTNWSIIAQRFGTSISAGLDDLTDVVITGAAEGDVLRYDTPANDWVNTSSVQISDGGRLSVNTDLPSAGISLGADAGVGNDVTLVWSDNKTLTVTGRTITNGTGSSFVRLLTNSVLPVVGNTYEVNLPEDNHLFCNMAAGDIFVRLPLAAENGDTIVVKDITGDVPVNQLVLVTEGVMRRNVPVLSATSPTGTIADATTTTIPGGVGIDEEQNFMVTGSGTFKVTFDGQEAATVFSETDVGSDIVTAINSLSPHPNYGAFTVSTTTPANTASAGINIVFSGGTLIDGQADFYAPAPYTAFRATYLSGYWYLT